MVYLNHAGTSFPKPHEVLLAVRQTLESPPEEWGRIYETAFARVRSEFPEPGRLLITTGCTSALALALGDLPWKAEDVLLTSSLEHHALDRQAQALELQRGVLRFALPYVPGAPLDLRRLKSRLENGRVRAVALTSASNITGERLPIEEVAALCRSVGALLIVDAAQTFGTSIFSDQARQADVIVAAGHKAALGPPGVGLLFAREGVEFSSPAAICEVGEDASTTFPGFCDVGSVNLPGLVGLAAGLTWSERQGRAEIARRTEAMAEVLRVALRERDDTRVLGPPPPCSNSGPVVSFVLPGTPLEAIEDAFLAAHLRVRVGTHCAPFALRTLGAPQGCVRVSFGPENQAGDVSLILGVLDGLRVR